MPQLTGMSCWAAAAAMLVGWRDSISARPDEIAHGAGYWEAYREGLDPYCIEQLSRHWNLTPLNQWQMNFHSLQRVLYNFGPVWVGEASPGLHSIVITGLYGDGTSENTWLRINDPWPIGRGERYSKSLADLTRDFGSATENVGKHTQILHCGGRRRPIEHFANRRGHFASEATSATDLCPEGHFFWTNAAVEDTSLRYFRWSDLNVHDPALDLLQLNIPLHTSCSSDRIKKIVKNKTEKIFSRVSHPCLCVARVSSPASANNIVFRGVNNRMSDRQFPEIVNIFRRNTLRDIQANLNFRHIYEIDL